MLLDFYESLAILLDKRAIDFDAFLNYFELKIISVYDIFMESPIFDTSKDRNYQFRNLTRLFNNLGLSIREKGEI